MSIFFKSLFLILCVLSSPFAVMFVYSFITDKMLKIEPKGFSFDETKKVYGICFLVFIVTLNIHICYLGTTQLLIEKPLAIAQTFELKPFEDEGNIVDGTKNYFKDTSSLSNKLLGVKTYSILVKETVNSFKEYNIVADSVNCKIERVGVSDKPSLTITPSGGSYKNTPHTANNSLEAIIYNPVATSLAMLMLNKDTIDSYSSQYVVRIP